MGGKAFHITAAKICKSVLYNNRGSIHICKSFTA